MRFGFNIKLYYIIFYIIVVVDNNVSAQDVIFFANSQSEYIINLPKNPSHLCSKAVDELRIYLKKITGVQLPCSDKISPEAKYIIFEEGYCSDSQFDVSKLNKDGFRIKNKDKNILISAASGQGLINAVYTFLEKYIGCRYYSADEIYIPRKTDIIIKNLTEDVENPPFIFRTIHYYNAYQDEYAKLNKLNSSTEDRISGEWGTLWVHTMHKLLNPDKYFKEHPEYFALRNGVRVKDQLCLSNSEVVDICIASLSIYMKKYPNAKYWSVSQMDNNNYCECEHCRAIDSMEGSHSGSIIHFVNKIAICFPDKIISTLAYQYSRKPPLHAIPADNVNIMLCTAECVRNKPISNDYSDGSMYDDLANWSLLTRNILVWDYVINFSHVLSPFPNFHVLQPNIQLFANYGADKIFEQGYAGKSSEMNELRCYLLAKLMWNPREDIDSLTNDFLTGYYGKAAPFIRQYLNLSTSTLLNSDKPLNIYESPGFHAEDFLSLTNITEYFNLFYSALMAVKEDSIKRHRVEMALQSIRYAWLEVCKQQVYGDNWIFQKDSSTGGFRLKPEVTEILDDFYRISKQYGPNTLSEFDNTPEEYYVKNENSFKELIVNHKAVGKKISFEKQFSRTYKANGQNSLIDGIKGDLNYLMLWQGWYGDSIKTTIDLDSIESINNIEISFLDDNLAWIMPPESVEIRLSNDNVNYYMAANYINTDAGKQNEKKTVTFKIPFRKTENVRYIQLVIKNIGKMPEWRGVNENAWIFLDEIVVN